MSLRNRKPGPASRRDRHSKILTQQGPRDRRMRLSLEIARKFFHLQDMLSFDKASKTVAWLLDNSKAAIAEAEAEARGGLPRSSATSTPPSMCSDSEHCQVTVLPRGGGGGVDQQKKTKEKRVGGRTAAKEWRAMARAKARERTEEKIRSRRTESFSTTPHDNAASFNDCDDPLHDDSSSLGLVIKQQQQQLGNEPIVSNPFAHQQSMVDDDDDDDDECINASAASDQAAMISSIFDYHQQQQHHLPHGINSANHLGSFQNNDMTINFFPDNWGEMGVPNHPNAPPTAAMLFKASAHHVQFCPKAWNNGFNNQSL